ncbi:MAG TPA: hypothetical protein PLE99_05545 [Candidatus Thiothrix moscowensis]|uniref:hypothetical protein n=1 Tax=unclassified Thiothrix TaxID=2636184 RepID=UPI0025F714E5|nr:MULTISPECIES: hypothetical protein [unclassified Thiothrix]HRJ52207.1 hypothetical protein [Candidatus Thiothrix moscowensis]HRJ92522.1 hypothetical protein [Candidatus Thiothrix moscowensis]
MNKITVTVMVEGGVVQKVCATNTSHVAEVEVMVIDHDTQSGDGVVVVPYLDGNNFPAHVGYLSVDPVDFDLKALEDLLGNRQEVSHGTE